MISLGMVVCGGLLVSPTGGPDLLANLCESAEVSGIGAVGGCSDQENRKLLKSTGVAYGVGSCGDVDTLLMVVKGEGDFCVAHSKRPLKRRKWLRPLAPTNIDKHQDEHTR